MGIKGEERFPGLVLGVSGGPPYQIWVQDEDYPLEFGPLGRLRIGLSFFLHLAEGHRRTMTPEKLTKFGPKGIVKGTKVWCYYREYGLIEKVTPRK